MADPFESLREPVTLVDPDPAFAAALRARIARLLSPGGISMTDLSVDLETGSAAASTSAVVPPDKRVPRHGEVTYASLFGPDVARAATFFGAVLGWRLAPGSSVEGRAVEGANPSHGIWGGQPRSTLFLCYGVDDIDAALAGVRDAGGTTEAPRVEPYGRVADCLDPEGTRLSLFELNAPAQPVAASARPGDLEYITMEVRDSARARAFYGAVLGWRFTPGRVADGWQVEGTWPMAGILGGVEQPVVVPFYRVADIATAVTRVREAGGTATDPERMPYGVTSNCLDDQGTRFYVGET